MTVIERAEKRLEEEAKRERTLYLTGKESNSNDLPVDVTHWMPLPEPPKEGNNGSSRKEASSDL